MLLSDATIQQLRTVEVSTFPDTYAVLRNVRTPNGKGGFTTVPSVSSSGRCRLREASGALERVVADRLGWSVAYAVDLPYTATVTPADRIEVNGRTFQIGGVVDTGHWAVKKTAVVSEQG